MSVKRPASVGLVLLSDILPRHRRLLIEGQPGAGKTTFTRLVTAVLARDRLEGTSSRKSYLGLKTDETPTSSGFFAPGRGSYYHILEGRSTPRADDRQWLLDYFEELSKKNRYGVDRADWESLFEQGDAMLLLDGLDEVAEDTHRDTIFSIFRDACDAWKDCVFVVTSRPIQTATLRQMGFHLTSIEPFGKPEIEQFLEHWVRALHEVELEAPLPAEAKAQADKLREAIVREPSVHLIATNPVMLTCLAVVHWNEGALPEGRSRVYQAATRWLIAARTLQRKKAKFDDIFCPPSVRAACSRHDVRRRRGGRGEALPRPPRSGSALSTRGSSGSSPTRTRWGDASGANAGWSSSASGAASSRRCRETVSGSGT